MHVYLPKVRNEHDDTLPKLHTTLFSRNPNFNPFDVGNGGGISNRKARRALDDQASRSKLHCKADNLRKPNNDTRDKICIKPPISMSSNTYWTSFLPFRMGLLLHFCTILFTSSTEIGMYPIDVMDGIKSRLIHCMSVVCKNFVLA